MGETPTVFGECMLTAINAVKKQLASDNPDVVLKAAKLIFDLERTGMRHNCEVTGGSVPANEPEPESPIQREEKPRVPASVQVEVKETKVAEPREMKAETFKPVPAVVNRNDAAPPKPVPSGKVSGGVRVQDLTKRKLTKFLNV
jgi:hypothetical protein